MDISYKGIYKGIYKKRVREDGGSQRHSVAPVLYTPPPASPVGERRLRRKHPGTQCHWLHAHARAAVPLAPAAALLGFLGLLLLVLDHLGMGEHRLDRAGHVVGLMACLAGR